MQPFQRPQFICSAIELCKEKAECCAHKKPHIKDERCVPRQCRYAPGVDTIDCDPYDPAHPRAPVIELVGPAKTVEQRMKEDQETKVKTEEDSLLKDVKEKEETGEFIPIEEASKELDIKESVKKNAQKKVQGRKKGKGS